MVQEPPVQIDKREALAVGAAEENLRSLGIAVEETQKVLRFLSADGAESEQIDLRAFLLTRLTAACGSLQNAKLAYSLAQRSGFTLDSQRVELLVSCLDCCDCVPAAVRLWKRAVEANIEDRSMVLTAARLGSDGAEQLAVLNVLRENPEQSVLVAELARRLTAPGWQAEGSWGGRPDSQFGLVWWDYARPHLRQPYGMVLSSDPISLRNRVGTMFKYQCAYDITGVTDRVHLEISCDGKSWDKVSRFEGVEDWHEQVVDLSDYDGKVVRLRFQVISGGQRQGRGFEFAAPRIETRPINCRMQIQFSDLAPGWHQGSTTDRAASLSGHQSEVPQQSEPLSLPSLAHPTLGFEGRMVASSVYAKGTVEVLGDNDEVLCALDLNPGSEWKNRTLALDRLDNRQIRIRLSARFNQRKDDDGLWVRNLSIYGGESARNETIALDGGGEDGSVERRTLLELIHRGSMDELGRLALLRRSLPTLRDALALLPLLEDEEQIPVLLHLSSLLGEKAVEAFALLKTLALSGEDLGLQCSVLLLSGTQQYASTRDHLGDGLLTIEEFEANCRIYLKLRESWSEEAAREGLSLFLTPVADETLEERRQVFLDLLEKTPQVQAVFSAWEQIWSA